MSIKPAETNCNLTDFVDIICSSLISIKVFTVAYFAFSQLAVLSLLFLAIIIVYPVVKVPNFCVFIY